MRQRPRNLDHDRKPDALAAGHPKARRKADQERSAGNADRDDPDEPIAGSVESLAAPSSEYATLVVSTDKRIDITSDVPWDIHRILRKHENMLVLDCAGMRGGGKYEASTIDPRADQMIVERTCDWRDLIAHGNRSVKKAVKESGTFSTVQLILGNAFSGAHDLRARNPRIDECLYYMHEDFDNPNRRLNRLQRARSCAYLLLMGFSSRDPAMKGIPSPIDSVNPGNCRDTYTLRLNVPGIFRTPAFSLTLLHEFRTYGRLSRRHEPADRKAVKGIARFIGSLPKQTREGAWRAIDQVIR